MQGKIIEFPPFSKWLRRIIRNDSNPIVSNVEKMIGSCLELNRQCPQKYGWRFSSVETIQKKCKKVKNVKELNQIYWEDQVRNAEAYGLFTFWRGIDLLKPAVRSLNQHEILPSAILARSCVELSAALILNANIIAQTLDKISFPKNTAVVSDEIEKYIVKTIWGTRLGTPEDYLKQTNILSILQKLSKKTKDKEIMKKYSYLCELAHPNFIGNALYWSHVECVHKDGSERRVLQRKHDKGITEEIIPNILWALGWSTVCLRNGVLVLQESIASLLSRLESS